MGKPCVVWVSCHATYIHNQVLHRKSRLCALLDVDPVLVLVPEKDFRDVPRAFARLDADRRRLDTRLDHVGVDHAHRLLAHLVGRDVDHAFRVARKDARHKAAVELAAAAKAAHRAVRPLELRSKDSLAARKKEAVEVALARDQARLARVCVRRVRRLEVRVHHADDLQAARTGELLDAALVLPRDAERQAIRLALLRRLVDRLDDDLDTHRHLVVLFVAPNEEAKALRVRLAPNL